MGETCDNKKGFQIEHVRFLGSWGYKIGSRITDGDITEVRVYLSNRMLVPWHCTIHCDKADITTTGLQGLQE